MAEAVGADIVDRDIGCPAKRSRGAFRLGADAQPGACGTPDVRSYWRNFAASGIEDTAGFGTTGVFNAPELAALAENVRITALTVHGRTRQQFYSGSANI